MERLKRREGASKGYREMVYDVGRKSRARGVTEAMKGASFQRKRALWNQMFPGGPDCKGS